MDCQSAQDSFLESLVTPLDAEQRLAIDRHIAACASCSRFADTQRKLDARLAAATPQVSLSPVFRTRLKAKIRRDAEPVWSDVLPEVAHVVGCVAATLVALALLPGRAVAVLAAGAVFTAVTYSAQALLRSFFERVDLDV